ncbi:MAG: CBS domain-containing protein [Acidimicrobiales bacterium]
MKPDQPLHEIVKRFASERADSLPVTEDDGSLIGVIAVVDVERAMATGLTRAPAP